MLCRELEGIRETAQGKVPPSIIRSWQGLGWTVWAESRIAGEGSCGQLKFRDSFLPRFPSVSRRKERKDVEDHFPKDVVHPVPSCRLPQSPLSDLFVLN